MNKQILLSICIPTYNRAEILNISLTAIGEQMDEQLENEIEILVSDNCSPDNTRDVIKMHPELHINYIRNNENIGADGNFLQCMNLAQGKYILLLGDDDILQPRAIKFIVNILKKKDWGCLHLSIGHKEMSLEEYEDRDAFIRRVSYMFTFMSTNIFRKDAIALIEHPDQYKKSNLLQMPFYIASALQKKENAIVKGDSLTCGLAAKTNGGYNHFQVFVVNYQHIWEEFLAKKQITEDTFEYLKKHIYNSYIKHYVLWLLFNKEKIRPRDKTNEGYYIDNAWKILFNYYGKEPYFYYSFVWCTYRSLRHRIGKWLHISNNGKR